MATFTLTSRQAKYQYDQSVDLSPVTTLTATFDAAAATAHKGSAIVAADVFELIKIPAGSLVLSVSAKVTKVEGAASTVNIGDGATAAGYVSALSTNALGTTNSFNATATPVFGVGKFYSADDTIDLAAVAGAWANQIVVVKATYIKVA